MKIRNLLFITHEATRTGAPMLLLYLIQWLKNEKPDWNLDILTLKKGELDEDFKKVANNYELYFDTFVSAKEYYKQRIFNKNFDVKTYCEKRFYSRYNQRKYNVIYANSVTSLSIGLNIKNNSDVTTKLICNVHELPTITELAVPNLKQIANGVDLFIAGSELVAQNLHEKYSIPLHKIKTVYDFTSFNKLPKFIARDNSSTFTVGAMGTAHWRKGHDLFFLMALLLRKKHPTAKITFRWIGSCPHQEKIILENDLLKSGLSSEYIKFEDSRANYSEAFQEMDLFLLTSREDPFPLVAIEAGAYGLPIITFDKATGINEIITKNKGGGYIVPYLDIDEMINKIMFYYKDREKLKEDGRMNQQSFKEFIVENTGPEIILIIKKLMS